LSLLFRSWDDSECVVYSIDSANSYLLSFFNAQLLQRIKQNVLEQDLVVQISEHYKIEESDAQIVLGDLISEYQSLGLVD
jgi:PqqD family protein of HPr-rel-A system